MPEITPEALARRLGSDGDVFLLDIRHGDAFEQWHISGSVNVDVYDELAEVPETARPALEGLPRDEEIVTVCGAGKLSAVATDLLVGMGYDARTLVDGMQGWGRVHVAGTVPVDGATLVQVARPGTGCLSYVAVSDGEAVMVDPSQYTDEYEAVLEGYDATLTAVVETHAHADHVSGASDLADAHGVPHYLHPADSGALSDTTAIEDGDTVGFGTAALTVVHTPGHTAGSVTLDLGGEALLTGDTLFLESVGRPDLEGGDGRAVEQRARTLYESVKRLLERPGIAFVLPAHDPGAPTPPTGSSLAGLGDRNPLLDATEAEFVRQITEDVSETPANHELIKRANVGETRLKDTNAEQLELGPNQCAAN